jgi:hypothetical protein
MNRGKLPLESPHWWPIVAAFKYRSEQKGSTILARQDIRREVRAGRVRTLRRHETGECELLPASAWDDLYCTVVQPRRRHPSGKILWGPSRIQVISHKLGRAPPGQWFFVWKPDFEKIFQHAPELPTPSTQTQEVPENRGRKPVHDRADLQSVALVLALRRKHGAPEKRRADVVRELREWCKQNKRKAPGDSTLYDIVAAAFRIKPTLKG